jgi:hypothetical protein
MEQQQQNYQQPAYRRQGPLYTQDTIDITPLFTIPLNAIEEPNQYDLGYSNTIQSLSNSILMNSLFQQLLQPRETGTTQRFQDVIVAPSISQIESSTTLRFAIIQDELHTCSICQDSYTEAQSIRTITHCRHFLVIIINIYLVIIFYYHIIIINNSKLVFVPYLEF